MILEHKCAMDYAKEHDYGPLVAIRKHTYGYLVATEYYFEPQTTSPATALRAAGTAVE